MIRLLVTAAASLAALGGPATALASSASWTDWARFQQAVVVDDVTSDKPAETLVTNLTATTGSAVDASGRLKRRAVPAKVDPKVVPYTCPPVTDLGDLVPMTPSVSVSPDGTKIAVLTRKAPRVRVNDESGISSLLVFEKHSAEHLEWSADGAWFALGEAVDRRTRVIVANLATKAKREVMIDAPVAQLRFSGDASTLYALAPGRLYAIALEGAAAAKLVIERPGLHWIEPGPKRLVFLADERAYLLVDPFRPAAEATTVFTPQDRGRVLAAEWAAGGRVVFVSHADTRQTCLSAGRPVVWEHSHAELLLVDVDAGKARPILQHPELPAPSKAGPIDTSDRPLIHTLWSSPDGSRVAALSSAKLFVFDAPQGQPVYDAAGGAAMRWRRDGQRLLLTTGDAVLALDTTTWEEHLLTTGLPADASSGGGEVALLDPDYLGGRLLFTVLEPAAKTTEGP